MMNEQQAIKFSGKAASRGIGIGPVRILEAQKSAVRPEKITENEVDQNIQKFDHARKLLTDEYRELKKSSGSQDSKDILEAQIQTLEDPEVNKTVYHKIKHEQLTAEYAIFSTYNDYIQLLESSDVGWANERAIDVVSIRDELVTAASDVNRSLAVEEGEVVFAIDIPPATMVKISKIKIAAIVMEKGGNTSHAVILSQSLGIPCVINVHWNRYQLKNGVTAIVDGLYGDVILHPSANDQKVYQESKKREAEQLKKVLKWVEKPDETTCGSTFSLRANVEFLDELPRLSTFGAKGVGLLRTETILFETDEFEVDAQINFYSKVLDATGKESVTIRLFDAGGDKLLDHAIEEANPFLGWRGVRMLLDEEVLLRKQLEAIYRVSAIYKGRLKILIPMISRIEEVHSVNRLCEEIQNNFDSEGVDYDPSIPVGIMVEVPSVALMADHIAKHTDFFSIGTNDLTQYTLAVDRGNEKISNLFDSFHPSVWKMINMTKEAANRNNIPISVCGEMASKPEAAACLVGMGIPDLSMNANAIPYVKAVLCTHSMKELKALSDSILNEDDLSKIHERLLDWKSA